MPHTEFYQPLPYWRSLEGEVHRNQILRSYEHWQLEANERLEVLTKLAADICNTPIALVSLVEEHRQWFPAKTGLDAAETPRNISICTHTMLNSDMLVVPDATQDERFADSPLVTDAPHIRFYAGVPLVSPEGAPLGSLCVIDTVAREGLTDQQSSALYGIAQGVLAVMEMNRTRMREKQSTARNRKQIQEKELEFQTLADAMPQMVWSTPPSGQTDYFNKRWCDFTGQEAEASYGVGWIQFLHPDDREAAANVWSHAVATQENYETEYRMRHNSGQYRWVLARGLSMRDESGEIVRWFGTCTDIHEQKETASRLELLSQELSHRIKNIFAVIGGLVNLSMREAPEYRDFGTALQQRIYALGRAHDYVRTQNDKAEHAPGHNSLKGLLAQLLAPYNDSSLKRVSITGDDADIDDQSATPIALIYHELGTNSAKYGALSSGSGNVAIEISVQDSIKIIWTEESDLQLKKPTHQGFGSKLIELSAARQLGGRIDFNWSEQQLQVVAVFPLAVMRR